MSHSIELETSESNSIPKWFDTAAPWISSLIFHLGLGLLVLFLAWLFMRVASAPDPLFFPITDGPGAMSDPLATPGERPTADPAKRIKEMLVQDKWPSTPAAPDISTVISRSPGSQDLDKTFSGYPGIGQHGSHTIGQITSVGPGGTGIGAGPRSYFLGITDGGDGTSGAFRIVYIIDHSGSLLDNFDFLREAVKASVNNLLPIQHFAVVAFSEDSEILGPPSLQRATFDAQHDLSSRIDQVRPQGENDGQLGPFQHAFEKAFALKPQLIYFLTDGAFDPKLADIITRLNVNHKVRINTLAFIRSNSQYEGQLKALAKNNGGIYKFVSEKDLGH